ncbi:Signal recognition particle subunit SRP72, partial [Caligus rogercresseyi]
ESGDLVEKKKKKLPMNYDPNVEPDPERWIPKRERIAFRKHLKRQRRNKGEKFTGAQGDNYDYSSRKATPKSPHQKTPQPTASRYQQQTRRQQRKENKKKGFRPLGLDPRFFLCS